jgi:hypothetical protein
MVELVMILHFLRGVEFGKSGANASEFVLPLEVCLPDVRGRTRYDRLGTAFKIEKSIFDKYTLIEVVQTS